MSTTPRRVLVVAPDPDVADTLIDWLSSQGHAAHVVTDFEAAKPELDGNPPDLLVTEVKLGAFNGLHLAIRARTSPWDTPSIVIGDPDCVLEKDARNEHVRYLTQPLEESVFSETARQMIGSIH
jgi:DNA-binding response OmpR family regulator